MSRSTTRVLAVVAVLAVLFTSGVSIALILGNTVMLPTVVVGFVVATACVYVLLHRTGRFR